LLAIIFSRKISFGKFNPFELYDLLGSNDFTQISMQNEIATNNEPDSYYDEPLVSVIIPTYNRKMKLLRLLESIYESDYNKDRIEIIVIDDASTDGTSEEINKKFPGVITIRNQIELLPSASRNIGIMRTKGEFIFLIDDDNVVDRNCIKELLKTLLHNEKIGFVGPVMYYHCNKERIMWAGAKRGKLTSITKIFTNFPTKDLIDTPYIPNAVMTRKKIIEIIGPYDGKNFPFQYDDGDFCQRGINAGYRIAVVSNAKVWHDIPLPENTTEKLRMLHCQTEKLAYNNSKSRIYYQFKYAKKSQFIIFIIFFNWAIALYYLKLIIFDSKRSPQEKIRLSKGYLRGVLDGIKKVFQDRTVPRYNHSSS